MPMRRLVSWGVVFLLFTAITHLGYVLFAPRYQMGLIMRKAVDIAAINTLAVLDGRQQAGLFPADTPAELRAICPFDLAGGEIALTGVMPKTPWMLSIYSPRGEMVYALRREQAGVDTVAIRIKGSKGLAGLVIPRENEAIINDGWTFESASQTGLAVIWVVFDNPLDRPRFEAILKTSSCTARPAP